MRSPAGQQLATENRRPLTWSRSRDLQENQLQSPWGELRVPAEQR